MCSRARATGLESNGNAKEIRAARIASATLGPSRNTDNCCPTPQRRGFSEAALARPGAPPAPRGSRYWANSIGPDYRDPRIVSRARRKSNRFESNAAPAVYITVEDLYRRLRGTGFRRKARGELSAKATPPRLQAARCNYARELARRPASGNYKSRHALRSLYKQKLRFHLSSSGNNTQI